MQALIEFALLSPGNFVISWLSTVVFGIPIMDLTSPLSKLQSALSSTDSTLNPSTASEKNVALTTSTPSLLTPRSSLLFIDSMVADYQSLIAGATAGTEVHLLDSTQNAISQITNTLMGREGIDSIHIVSHGGAGNLDFADGLFNLSNLPEYAKQIQSWGQALTNDADILLYGCNVAEGELGKAFVQILSQLSGADVAASDDLTGSAAQGGNWTMEFNTGSIESSLAFQQSVLQGYGSVFSHFASGTMGWIPTGGNSVRFEGFQTWRTGAFSGVSVGSVLTNGDVLQFGDNSTQQIYFRVVEVNASSGLFIAEIGTGASAATFQSGISHTYATSGNYTASFSGCCRLSDLQNNADGNYRQETLVTLGSGNAAPVTEFPSGFQVVDNTLAQIQITASDPDGDTLRYRLATPTEMGGGTNPSTLSINSTTGLLTFDVRDTSVTTTPGNRWSTQVIIEDIDSQGNIKSRISLDMLILVSGTNAAPTASAGGPYNVLEGGSVKLTGTASDPDGFVISREWDFDYDGVTFDVDAVGAFPTFVAGAAGNKTIAFRATDSIGATAISTATVTINPDPNNNAPVNTVPVVRNGTEDTVITFTGGSEIQIADPDAGDSPVRTTLTIPIAAGILSATAAGATITGNGTNSLVIDGTVTAINNTLASLALTPTANYNSSKAGGPFNLTIFTEDLGNTGLGGAKTDTDNVSITIGAVNDLPTGATAINPSPRVNQTLTADTSTLNDADGLGTLSYQWQQLADDHVTWIDISGATSQNLALDNTYLGKHVRAKISYTDGQGTLETVFSNQTNHVAPSNNSPTGNVLVSGTSKEDQTLTADASSISDADGVGPLSYQWEQSSDGTNWSIITGATSTSLSLGDLQVGKMIRMRVSYTDGLGNAENVYSVPTVNVANVNDLPTGTVAINGTVQEDQVLTADASGIGDADGLGTFNYQWEQSSDGTNWTTIDGATNVNFTPGDAQVGQRLRVRISYTDGYNTAETVYGTPTAPVAGVNDAPTLNAPASITVTESTATSITGITFNDVDAGNGILTATFAVPTGILAAANGSGVTVGGTATNLTLSGTLSAINAFIAAGSLKYTSNSSTAQTLNVTINDNGTGGIGGPLTANATVNLPVTAIPPSVSISNVSRSEGTRGNKTYTFTVNLSKASNQPITIGYATADGTAKVSDNDYVAANSTLTFNANETSKTFTVTVNGDSKLEATENFLVNLSLVSGTATIANGTAKGIIGDDDGNGMDLNLDGKVDMFWRNASASQSGVWFMNGSSLVSAVTLPSVNSDWRMEETGDFNDDGIDDFVWHNTRTLQTGIWLMNGASIASIVDLGAVQASWRVEKVGDFDGDNKVDLFWRNTATGENAIWLMNGTAYSTFTMLAKADLTWAVAGVGDFDGDRDLDILWRNTSTGATGIWNLNNASFGTVTTLATASPDWVVGDIADLDGDGDLDILWHNTKTDDVGIWQMNGTTLQSYGALPKLMNDPGWRVRDIVDFDGDGKLDIFWRKQSGGTNGVWHMNGMNFGSAEVTTAADPNWVPFLDG